MVEGGLWWETSGGGPLVASEVSVGLSRKTHVLCDVDNFGRGFVFYEKVLSSTPIPPPAQRDPA